MAKSPEEAQASAVDQALLKLLVCPETKAPVVQIGDWLYSTDQESRRRYPVRDGIPIMLIDESEVVENEEYQRIMGTAKASR